MKQCCKDYLMEQFGDEDVVTEIYAEYTNSIHEKMPEIEAALTAEDWSGMDSLVHALKGNALAVGDNDTAEVAIALRVAAKMAEKDTAQALFEKLKVFAAQV